MWCGLHERKKDLIDNEWFDFFDTLNIIRIKPYLTNNNHKKIFDEVLAKTPCFKKGLE
jgi:hypothetical protein